MRIVVAPDKFKGSLGAREVAENIAAGLRDVIRDAQVTLLPVADGGEGTAEVIGHARGGEWLTCSAHDALGRSIETRYRWIAATATAIMEMSEAAGSWRLAPGELNPNRANTFGVGEMLLDAAKRGAQKIVVGLGGSATTDGGFGMARALGFRFLDRNGRALTGDVLDLFGLSDISAPEKLQLPHITAAADVGAPLLGPTGATHTFASQKGARSDQLAQFEAAVARLADVVAKDLGCDFRAERGAGAAGGLGFGLMSFCGAEMSSGFELVAEIIGLRGAIEAADVIVTGEGRLDAQTLEGKAPAGVARMSRSAGKRVFAIVGSTNDDARATALFDRVWVLARSPITSAEAIQRAGELLRIRARELALTLETESAAGSPAKKFS